MIVPHPDIQAMMIFQTVVKKRGFIISIGYCRNDTINFAI